MVHLLLKTLFLGMIGLLALVPQENGAKPVKKAKPPQKVMNGSFGARGGGVGFVALNGRLFIDAIVIHGDVVESGIFLMDTATRTGCVMETYFAEKMKIMGLGNVTLKFGQTEITHVKATVLDHPELQQAFKDNTALFQNRPICGVIGYSAFAARTTILDFKSYTAIFKAPPAKPKEGNGSKPSPIQKKNTALILPYRDDLRTMWLDMRLNDKVDAVFQVNTGSPYSWISKQVADKAGIRKGRAPRSMKVGGIELPPPSINLRILKEPPLAENSTPFPVAGCLGTDYLLQYRVTIDPAGKHLLLEPLK